MYRPVGAKTLNSTKTNGLNKPSQSDQTQRPTLAEQFRERREQNRRQTGQRMFIQIVACNDQALIGTTCACQAVDSSANGLQLVCSDNIPAGSQLDLWVDIASKPGKYFLTSEVLWSQRTENGSCNIGVLLQNAAATDIDKNGRFLHRLEQFLVKKVMGIVGHRQNVDHKITLCQH